MVGTIVYICTTMMEREHLLQQIANRDTAVDKDMTVEEACDLVCNDLKCIYGLKDSL